MGFNRNNCGCCRPLENFRFGTGFNSIGLTNISGGFFGNMINNKCCGCNTSCGCCNTSCNICDPCSLIGFNSFNLGCGCKTCGF